MKISENHLNRINATIYHLLEYYQTDIENKKTSIEDLKDEFQETVSDACQEFADEYFNGEM